MHQFSDVTEFTNSCTQQMTRVSNGGSQMWQQRLSVQNISQALSHRHYGDVLMGTMVYQIISLAIVCSTVYSGADQRKHQSSASLAFVRGIHRGPVNSPHKWPVTRKMFPFDEVIMDNGYKVTQVAANKNLKLTSFIEKPRDQFIQHHQVTVSCFFSIEYFKSHISLVYVSKC